MRRNKKSISKQGSSLASFFNKLASVFKLIRIEFLISLIGLMLTLGQYFQHSINVRINMTGTWREGYTSETRTRVNRFIYHWNKWKSECLEKEGDICEERIKETISIFTSNEELFGISSNDILFESKIKNNDFITRLVKNEIDAIGRARKANLDKTNLTTNPEQPAPQVITMANPASASLGQTNPTQPSPEAITNEEYIEIIFKYRNAIIECLNTMEAVKAVIQSKPLPFKITIFYKDTLEGRYRDIIEELKENLMDFIAAYREEHSDRETEAWYVLTSDESYLNDLVNVVLYVLVFFAALTSVYLVKIKIQKLGYLQENAK